MKPEKILSICAAAALLGISAPLAIAQTSDTDDNSNRQMVIEEVIVTATKRAVNVQDVPQAISVVSGQMMEDLGATGFNDLVDHMAGVEYRSGQAGRGDIAMRGISTFITVEGGPGAVVGLYVDELPLTMAGIFPDIKSFDVDRIEVLRGPQGTLFGEGSLAGTIRLVTHKPDPTAFSGRAELTYSDTRHGESNFIGNAVVNIPLGETLALRASGIYSDMGGYVDVIDLSTGEPSADNANTSKTVGGRIALGWTPNDKLEINLSAIINSAEQGVFSWGNRDYVHSTSVLSNTDDDLNAYNLTINYDFDFANFVSSSSYFDRDYVGDVANDGLVPIVSGLYGMFGLPAAGPITGVFIDQDITSKAFAQELRLVSNSSGKWQWTAGVFYKKQDFSNFFTGESVPPITEEETQFVAEFLTGLPLTDNLVVDNNGTYKQKAVFGEVSYDFTENFQALFGGRWFKEDRDSTSTYGGLFPVLLGAPPGELLPPASSDGSSNLFNPKLTLTYNFDSPMMIYGTVSEGFRSGGQNDFASLLPGAPADYDPETLTNYEIGFKSVLLDGRMVFNAAAYYMEWKDLQATIIEGPGGAFEASDNVGDAHSMGIDLELTWEPVDGLVFNAAATLLEAETDEVYFLPDPGGGPPQVAPKGSRIPGVAEQAFNLGGQYNFEFSGGLGAFVRLDYAYVGDSVDILINPIEVPSYQIFNARFGIEAERWSAALFVDNFTDEFITWDKHRDLDPWAGQTYTLGRPRTFGVTVRYNW